MSVLPKGTSWLPHYGKRAARRNLRHSWQTVLRLKGWEAERARMRVTSETSEEPDAEFAKLQLAHAALLASLEARVSWWEAMDHILDGFKRNEENSPAELKLVR